LIARWPGNDKWSFKMPVFYPNLGFLFKEHDLLDRVDAAKACGFGELELPFPYSIPLDTLKVRLAKVGSSVLTMNTSAGDVAGGEFGLAGVPGREADFAMHWQSALEYGRALGVRKIHVMAGVVEPARRQEAMKSYVANLRVAAREAAALGITLLLEPINQRDKPNYLVSHCDVIADVIAEIGEANVKLLFDVYHIQVMEGDLIRRMQKHFPIIGHVQIAAAPSRHEPDEGEIAYGAIFSTLEELGYKDPIAMEYNPRGRTEDGLVWMKKF